MRNLLVVALCLFASVNVLSSRSLAGEEDTASRGRLLIYAQDADYLLPLIENRLRDLRLCKRPHRRLFRDVINLNTHVDETERQRILREVVLYYGVHNLDLDESAKDLRAEAATSLLAYDWAMLIKINPLGTLLEYQFSLYERLDSDASGPVFPAEDVRKPAASECIFINPDSPDYSRLIDNAIRRIFPESNSPPQVAVRVNNRLNESGMVYYVGVGDSVVLDARESNDLDTVSYTHLTLPTN